MKLYKFRSLEKYNRISEILSTGEFYSSDWRNLNDPMEGLFYYIANKKDHLFSKEINDFINKKNNLKICSFSNTYKSILLWTHYANKHKGIAIEITLNSRHYPELEEVKYFKNIPTINFNIDKKDPKIVLTKKIKFWRYEREYRFISENQKVKIGKITGIFLGIRTEQKLIDQLKNDFPKTRMYKTKLDVNKNRIVLK